MEMVTMKHSVTGGVSATTKAAFDEVWSELGWKIVSDDTPHVGTPDAYQRGLQEIEPAVQPIQTPNTNPQRKMTNG